MVTNTTSIIPKPVVTVTLCSLCDEPWEAHGKNPTAKDCIRLLKAKLAEPRPYVAPYIQKYPTYPYWYTYTSGDTVPLNEGIKCGNLNEVHDGHVTVCYNTPTDVQATACVA